MPHDFADEVNIAQSDDGWQELFVIFFEGKVDDLLGGLLDWIK